ncbi:CatB-related O-acetyltransferase [Lysobacter sp. HA35]
MSAIPEFRPADSRVSVGRFTYGNPAIRMWLPHERVEIGSFCSIAEDVTIFGGGEHRVDWVTTFPMRIAFAHELAHVDGHPSTKGPTCIGHDVWLGHGATILSGVQIGHGAVIGARAVVTSDVSPYAVVGGNPGSPNSHKVRATARRRAFTAGLVELAA